MATRCFTAKLETRMLHHCAPSRFPNLFPHVPQPDSGACKKPSCDCPDYIGFGYSDAPSAKEFSYTFDNLATRVEGLLFGVLGLKKFSIYVQDYGAPVEYRIASKRPQTIDSIVVQNGNAYVEGIGAAFDPMKPFWANRNTETEKPVRTLLTLETTTFQYTHGAKNPKRISPDNWTFDRSSSTALEMTRSNSTCSTTTTPTSRATTNGTSISVPASLAR
jgi:hypothetical protein